MSKNKHESKTNTKLTDKQIDTEKLSSKELDKVSGGQNVVVNGEAYANHPIK